jgi:hypothetical protein
MNKDFHAFADEAEFTIQILGSGVTEIRNANYANKGKYFHSFNNLSTGLERIGKLCILLDYFIHNKGEFPDNKDLKLKVGHDLESIYRISKQIVHRNNLKFDFNDNLDDLIFQNIMKILSDFAKGDRYRNIDLLGKLGVDKNPILKWSKHVDEWIFVNKVSPNRKANINANAKVVAMMLENISIVEHQDENGAGLNTIFESSAMTGKYMAIRGWRQFYVSVICRYWVEILRELEYKARAVKTESIPFMGYMFAIFYNDNRYLKSRKRFDSIR